MCMYRNQRSAYPLGSKTTTFNHEFLRLINMQLLNRQLPMLKSPSLRSTTTLLGVSSLLLMTSFSAFAADHQEAPRARAQLAADIGDYYAWHEDNQLNVVLTFGTFNAPGMPATYDSNLLYGFHFDTSATADGESDTDLYVRFAQDDQGLWGVQISDTNDNPLLQGAVETILINDQLSAWTGLADDPFFFDQTGFVTTVGTGTLSFDATRDDVAGLNITAIVIQLPVDSIKSGGGSIQSWTTTASL